MTEPQRIVSLVPSHTETLHGLGLADRVVGRTRFCIHPEPWVATLPIVGGTKDAKLERIQELRPDLVVADKDENPKALVDALTATGIEVLWSDIATIDDAAAFVLRLAERCGGPAPEAAARWEGELQQARRQGGAGAPIPVFCPIWFDPWMTFNGTAYPSAMLAAAGLRNVFAERPADPRYFAVTAEEVAAAGARWSLLPTEPYPFHRRREAVSTTALGTCGQPERVRIVDGEALTWFGMRTLPGLRELRRVATELRAVEAAARDLS